MRADVGDQVHLCAEQQQYVAAAGNVAVLPSFSFILYCSAPRWTWSPTSARTSSRVIPSSGVPGWLVSLYQIRTCATTAGRFTPTRAPLRHAGFWQSPGDLRRESLMDELAEKLDMDPSSCD